MPRTFLKSLGFLALLTTLSFAPLDYVRAENSFISGISNVSDQTGQDSLMLTIGKAEVVAIKGDVSDIIVSNPALVEVGPVKDGQIYLIGTAPGTTNVLVMDQLGNLLRQINVTVNADAGPIEEKIREGFPKEKVTIETLGNQIILKGSASNATTATQLKDLATRFAPKDTTIVNNMTVSDGQQVMMHVKIVEVSRNLLSELGLETDVGNLSSGNFSAQHSTAAVGGGASAGAPAMSGPLVNNPLFGLTVEPSFGNGALIYDSGGTGPINLLIHALERDGLVNTLAQPNLTAISGENARFLAGGEFPIPSGRDNNGNISYEYKPFGVSLAFRPIVLDKNRINLQIATEVSEVSTELTLQLPGVTVPSFSVRRAETTVELASGGSLMIAGLIESGTVQRMNGLPGIRDVPVLGALVRSESFTRNETELLILITAYLAEPIADKQAERVIDPIKRTEPLNIALAQSLALSYGNVVNNYTQDAPFGFIME
ncbi:MAG TPA: type II and III secretion system protein family protein [Alphaproteobacteria bacterium]